MEISECRISIFLFDGSEPNIHVIILYISVYLEFVNRDRKRISRCKKIFTYIILYQQISLDKQHICYYSRNMTYNGIVAASWVIDLSRFQPNK